VAFDFASDLETIFDTDECAEAAIYTRMGFPTVPIDIIFQNDFVAVQGLGDASVGGSIPIAFSKTADVADAARGDRLKVGDVNYYVAEVRHGNGGVTLMVLSEDPV